MEGNGRPSAGMKEGMRLCLGALGRPQRGAVTEWDLIQAHKGRRALQVEEQLRTSPSMLSKLQTAVMAIMWHGKKRARGRLGMDK